MQGSGRRLRALEVVGRLTMLQTNVRGRLRADLKAAVRAQDSARVATLRLVLAAIDDAEADLPDGEAGLDDAAVRDLIRRLHCHCEEAAAGSGVEGNAQVRELRRAERAVLAEYLPEPMNEAEMALAVEQALGAAQARSIRDLGKTMAELRKICTNPEDLARARREARRRLEA
ncbi:MAG: GatB/YqeY domain-containing protein [Rhodospirillales bacterium]|nr:GatB/YqeY domain-containing protein [Rhodospirillales bacterium]